MYLTIIILPLLGSIVAGVFGRKVGVSGAQLITCLCIIITTLLTIVAFIEVGLNKIPVSINLFRWIDSESLNILWGFHFDSLTVSMLIPVLIVSSLVHIYSIGYMSHDPHNQRFFSYLSLFTFMMVVLVTANNFMLMFVGWEGYHNSLKWQFISKYFNFNRRNITTNNLDYTSLIVGSLLGNSYLEKNEKGIRFIFIKCSNNIEYLMKFFNFIVNMGYCKAKKPKLNKIISKNNKIFYYIIIESFYSSKFEVFYNIFYKDNYKILPSSLKDYLTPLSIATWYLDNTDKIYISNNQSFCLKIKDLNFISHILKEKYNVETIYKLESKGKIVFYFENDTFNNLCDIVKPYISSSLEYKLKESHNKLVLRNNYYGGVPFLLKKNKLYH